MLTRIEKNRIRAAAAADQARAAALSRPGVNPGARVTTRVNPSGSGIRKSRAAKGNGGVWDRVSPNYRTHATIDSRWDSRAGRFA